MKHYISAALIFISASLSVSGKENINMMRTAPAPQNTISFAGCEPSKSRADLDVNNVRTPIWINGDMWWDLVGNALYEVPVGSGKHSLFAGAIWIGGKDAGGQLKVAAQTYRQSGSDFWPGPIDTATTTITPDQCLKYDHHYKITLTEVRNFHDEYQLAHNSSYPVPDIIKKWPGNGDPSFNQAPLLAPFHDENGDGTYNIDDGDYPKYYLPGTNDDPCDKNLLLGDQTIWWVFNDVGNIHVETQSQAPVGIEIQAQAFGFNTNDEVNNMTFYRYKIINRNTTILNQTYFGAWVDPDLGNYLDDYVGCDVGRGLGYCYNGDADDDGALGYGLNPPAVGVDFFEGPLADIDSIDNDRDGVIDEPGEQIIMSKFVYYNNDNTVIGNPNNAAQYYGYLDGVWKDNTILYYGGNGHVSSALPCDFMFPGDSDPNHIGTHGTDPGFDWTETQPTPTTPPNEPSDRRFLQSAGKFTLQPGAVNYITTGVVWARTSSGGPLASVKLLKIADVKAQNLFEACFKVVDGPDAPELSIRELDKEILVTITNPAQSNNYKERYSEKDANIPRNSNARFTFEGYQVFQVKDPSVSVTDLLNPDRSRLVYQTDLQNGLSQIVNKTLNGDLSAYVPVEQVLGADKGLKHSFRVTTDAFASGDPNLVNHKTYYFIAIAYAYDSVADILDPFTPPTPDLYGQPYIQSRKSASGEKVQVYTAIPHILDAEANGLILGTSFGDGPEITRRSGTGNGYIFGSDRPTIDLKQSQVEDMLFYQSNPTNKIEFPVYERGRGPVDIRIFDPVKVPPAEFELYLNDTITNKQFVGVTNNGSNLITEVHGDSLAGIAVGQSVTSLTDGFPLDATITAINSTGPFTFSIEISKPLTSAGTDSAAVISASSKWFLRNVNSGRVDTSEKTIQFPYDQVFPDYGFYISLNQVKAPGESPTGGNGSIGGTLEFSSGNQNNGWLTGIPDVDNFEFFNWILSGNNSDPATYTIVDRPGDGAGFYEKILGGTWAPFYFASRGAGLTTDYVEPAPAFSNVGSPSGLSFELDSLRFLSSVDIVITKDQSKWSRCVVFELGKTSSLNEGSQVKNLIRKHPSLNLDGSYSTTDSGYSYFPGYAINVETGERLNIAFGEDSHLPDQNGADMKWNPTSNLISTSNGTDITLLAGGKHYVYVFGDYNPEKNPLDTSFYGPAYDGCQSLHDRLWGVTQSQLTNGSINRRVTKSWKDCMWVGTTILNTGQTLLSSDAKIRLRVSKPYRKYATSNNDHNGLPFYTFGTSDLVTKVNQQDVAKNALDQIRVVPNPYYAYSNYEVNQLDNRVKIVNLPPKCVISIYTPSGTLIRRFNRDAGSNSGYNNSEGAVYPDVNLESSVDWDLKNLVGVPVASGMYIIHVQANGVGEKTLKWFGVMRPIDLDTF